MNNNKPRLVVLFDAIQCYTDYRYLQQYYILTEDYIYFLIIETIAADECAIVTQLNRLNIFFTIMEKGCSQMSRISEADKLYSQSIIQAQQSDNIYY